MIDMYPALAPGIYIVYTHMHILTLIYMHIHILILTYMYTHAHKVDMTETKHI